MAAFGRAKTTAVRISKVLLESPSQFVGASPHDLMGWGRANVAGRSLQLVIRPRGLAGLFMRERRAFDCVAITGWDQRNESIEFTVGSIGMVATNAASVPVHICHFRCRTKAAADALTEGILAGGTPQNRITRR